MVLPLLFMDLFLLVLRLLELLRLVLVCKHWSRRTWSIHEWQLQSLLMICFVLVILMDPRYVDLSALESMPRPICNFTMLVMMLTAPTTVPVNIDELVCNVPTVGVQTF